MITRISWLLTVAGLLAVALWLGLLSLLTLGYLAAPLAFVLGHYLGYRKAARRVGAIGHAKADADEKSLLRAWRLW